MRFRRHEEAAQQSTRRLLVLFVGVVVLLVLAVNAALAAAYWLMVPIATGLPKGFYETNTGLVLLFVLGGCWVESLRLSKGGLRVAELAGARAAQPGGHDEAARRERRYVNVVQEMALASGQRPPPAAWVLPRDDAINALAAGWGPDDAVVIVTRGALERLTRDELQGVVAHEFSHLVHGDTRLNMRLIGLVWGLQMVWGLGQSLWAADEHGRRHAGALFGLALLGVGSLGWLAGRVLQAAVSRQREFLADASAVKFARHVDGLGGALRKIADQQARRIAALSSAHAASLAHLLLSSRSSERRGGWSAWLATHPTLAERLARLYGREVDADSLLLAADVVPLEATSEAVVALAPRLAHPEGAEGLPPDAHRHDATQIPAFHDAAEREREALERIERWHGPGEWQAAMLALSIERDRPDTPERLRRYEALTADLGTLSSAVLADVARLGRAVRLDVFDLLLQRAAAMPPAQRAALHASWATRWRALHRDAAPDATSALRALVIRRALRHTPQRVGRGTLASEASAVLAATAWFANHAINSSEALRAGWHAAALRNLQQAGWSRPQGPGAGLAPPVQPPGWRAALRVRRLSAMQRPLLVKGWLAASPMPLPDAMAQALHLGCLALELPQPPQLRVEPVGGRRGDGLNDFGRRSSACAATPPQPSSLCFSITFDTSPYSIASDALIQ